MVQKKVSLIGLGNQNMEDHLPAILASRLCELDSVCDSDVSKLSEFKKVFPEVPIYNSVDSLLAERQPDIAIVALPHHLHEVTVEKLSKAKIDILKEKPFALNFEQGKSIEKLVNESGVKLMSTLQRRFNPIFTTYFQLEKNIGKIFNVEMQYTMNLSDVETGWRASKLLAGGGVVIDMGYHMIDLIVWYFGYPETIYAQLGFNNKANQKYDVEDTGNILMKFSGGMTLSMFLSRISYEKVEKITVFGSKGSIEIIRGQIRRLDEKYNEIEKLNRLGAWPSAAIDQIEFFIDKYNNNDLVSGFSNHFKHLAIIDAIYESDKQNAVIALPKLN